MTSRELHDWIVLNTEAGHPPDTLLDRLLEAGWSETVALDALESTLRSRAAELGVVTVPEPDLIGSPTSITVSGRQVDVMISIRSPRLVVFRNFLSDEECDAVIEAARPRLSASTVIDNDSGANAMHEGRVSEGMFFARCESSLIRNIEERISELVRWPLDHGETIQVLRYGIGGKYDPHHDYFDPTISGSAEPIRIAGNRVGTLIMVLQAPVGREHAISRCRRRGVCAERKRSIFLVQPPRSINQNPARWRASGRRREVDRDEVVKRKIL